MGYFRRRQEEKTLRSLIDNFDEATGAGWDPKNALSLVINLWQPRPSRTARGVTSTGRSAQRTF
jgi:hypothetical protein